MINGEGGLLPASHCHCQECRWARGSKAWHCRSLAVWPHTCYLAFLFPQPQTILGIKICSLPSFLWGKMRHCLIAFSAMLIVCWISPSSSTGCRITSTCNQSLFTVNSSLLCRVIFIWNYLESPLQRRDEKGKIGTGDKGQEGWWAMLENAGGDHSTTCGNTLAQGATDGQDRFPRRQ